MILVDAPLDALQYRVGTLHVKHAIIDHVYPLILNHYIDTYYVLT
jgi:hypothetical protein